MPSAMTAPSVTTPPICSPSPKTARFAKAVIPAFPSFTFSQSHQHRQRVLLETPWHRRKQLRRSRRKDLRHVRHAQRSLIPRENILSSGRGAESEIRLPVLAYVRCRILGIRPTYWKPYASKFPNEQRVAQVLDWLKTAGRTASAFHSHLLQ